MLVKNEVTVLKIVVGASGPLSRVRQLVERQIRLERQHDEAEDEHERVEQQQGDGVLLPGLRPGVEAVFDPAEPAGGLYRPSMIQAR